MIICFSGWRHWTDSRFIHTLIQKLCEEEILGPPNQVRVGDCPSGVDKFVRALLTEMRASLCVWTADWSRYGKQAGPVRNQAMLLGIGCGDMANLLIALPEPGSYPARGSGTWGCIGEAWRLGIEVRMPAYQETLQ